MMKEIESRICQRVCIPLGVRFHKMASAEEEMKKLAKLPCTKNQPNVVTRHYSSSREAFNEEGALLHRCSWLQKTNNALIVMPSPSKYTFVNGDHAKSCRANVS